MRILEIGWVYVIVLVPVEITLSALFRYNNDLCAISRISIR